MVTCCWDTEEARELGQKRCRGRVWGVFFLLLGVSEVLASSMGWRIRRRALINLTTLSQSEAIQTTTLTCILYVSTSDNSPVVNLQQGEVGLQGDLFLLIFCRVRVLGGTEIILSIGYCLYLWILYMSTLSFSAPLEQCVSVGRPSKRTPDRKPPRRALQRSALSPDA